MLITVVVDWTLKIIYCCISLVSTLWPKKSMRLIPPPPPPSILLLLLLLFVCVRVRVCVCVCVFFLRGEGGVVVLFCCCCFLVLPELLLFVLGFSWQLARLRGEDCGTAMDLQLPCRNCTVPGRADSSSTGHHWREVGWRANNPYLSRQHSGGSRHGATVAVCQTAPSLAGRSG